MPELAPACGLMLLFGNGHAVREILFQGVHQVPHKNLVTHDHIGFHVQDQRERVEIG